MSTKRKKCVWISSGVLAFCIIAAAVATYFVLSKTQDGNETTTPFPITYPVSTTPGPAPPVIKVTADGGSLRGEWVTVPEQGFTYAAFRGVPYARPPVGPLRFKAPLPVVSWSDERDATTEGSECLQQDIYTQNLTGSEDCLYLNVYSPLSQGAQLPVYLFIHGGTFMFGSGSRTYYGPDYFMLQNMVVVTINYRLNAFGFLNLDDEVVPGNAGIKDQIAALRWVHDNIGKFGGNPGLITIGGQSAGAVSAHWLTLLPESRDLVNRVILESGSAVHSFAYNEDNFDVAIDLATRLSNGTVSTVNEMGQLFMELPAMEILNAAVTMAAERMNTKATQIPFATSPERRTRTAGGQTPLITQDPELYVLQDDKPVPMLVGMNSREWLYSFYYYGYAAEPDYMRYRIENLKTVFPKSVVPKRETAAYLNLTNTLTIEEAVAKVHSTFFEHFAPDCNDTCVFKKYLDEIVIGTDINRLAELRARNGHSETFVYRFGVRAKYSTSPLVDPAQAGGGAVHSDELGYLWKMGMLQQRLTGDGLASDTLRRMVNMWSSYVRSGTPDPGEAVDGNWQHNEERSTSGHVIFMNISETLVVTEEAIAGVNAPFWLGLFQQYRDYHST